MSLSSFIRSDAYESDTDPPSLVEEDSIPLLAVLTRPPSPLFSAKS